MSTDLYGNVTYNTHSQVERRFFCSYPVCTNTIHDAGVYASVLKWQYVNGIKILNWSYELMNYIVTVFGYKTYIYNIYVNLRNRIYLQALILDKL